MLLRCQHCNYTWNYRGGNAYYATCPRCRFKVKVPEGKSLMLRRRTLNRKLRNSVSMEEQPVKLLGIAGIVNKVVEDYQYDKSMLIQILLRLERDFGWLPRDMLWEVSEQLKVPLGQVYQIATFYKAFSLAPRGRHVIRICMGTSCRVRGAPVILDRVQRLLGIECGETTPDGRFSLETVNCLGCCALGPMMTIDGEYYGNLKPHAIKRILTRYT